MSNSSFSGGPVAPEANCEEVFEVLDEYVEAVIRGRDVRRSFARVVAHLRHCADCDEEAASLMAVLLALDLGRPRAVRNGRRRECDERPR